MHDWLDDLGEFGASIVAEAIKRYRQCETFRKRPLPGDIRHLCCAIQREDAERNPARRLTHHRPPPIIEAPPADDVVRDNWRRIPFPQLTNAEMAIFRDEARRSCERSGISPDIVP